ncbi:SURF1 family cytochrome oxidase biogenesis protein, partial [Bradyrhizobium guangdongense]
MNEPARKARVGGFALFTLFLTAVFVALGVWQLQRRTAKHELIAALTERLAAA